MFVRLLVTVVLFQVAYSNERHRMRHQGLVAEALRKRLGISEEEVILPDLQKVLSTIREEMHTEHERLLQRFASMRAGEAGNMEDQFGTDQGGIEKNSNTRIIEMLLSHVLASLQTVQGGQEAKRWMDTLKETSKSTSKPSHDDRHSLVALLRNVSQNITSNEIESSTPATKR